MSQHSPFLQPNMPTSLQYSIQKAACQMAVFILCSCLKGLSLHTAYTVCAFYVITCTCRMFWISSPCDSSWNTDHVGVLAMLKKKTFQVARQHDQHLFLRILRKKWAFNSRDRGEGVNSSKAREKWGVGGVVFGDVEQLHPLSLPGGPPPNRHAHTHHLCPTARTIVSCLCAA